MSIGASWSVPICDINARVSVGMGAWERWEKLSWQPAKTKDDMQAQIGVQNVFKNFILLPQPSRECKAHALSYAAFNQNSSTYD